MVGKYSGIPKHLRYSHCLRCLSSYGNNSAKMKITEIFYKKVDIIRVQLPQSGKEHLENDFSQVWEKTGNFVVGQGKK